MIERASAEGALCRARACVMWLLKMAEEEEEAAAAATPFPLI